METVSYVVRVSIPEYLKNLPLPNSISGFASLSGRDWVSLVPFVSTVSLIVYVSVRAVLDKSRGKKAKWVNARILKDSPKVVNVIEGGNLPEPQVAYCRCWKSKKFPYCDGSHNQHNADTGDNVGPLLVKKGEICNPGIDKTCPKVVNSIDMEDLANKDKVSFCRCWRSQKFPYCDGTHNKHNETTGDNIGPLVLKKRQ